MYLSSKPRSHPLAKRTAWAQVAPPRTYLMDSENALCMFNGDIDRRTAYLLTGSTTARINPSPSCLQGSNDLTDVVDIIFLEIANQAVDNLRRCSRINKIGGAYLHGAGPDNHELQDILDV